MTPTMRTSPVTPNPTPTAYTVPVRPVNPGGFVHKVGVFDRLIGLHHRVVGSGEQIRDILRRFFSLPDIRAFVGGLTNSAETASTTPLLESKNPKGCDNRLCQGAGLGIPEPDGQDPPPDSSAAHLEKARKALQATIIAAQKRQTVERPTPIRSGSHAPTGSADPKPSPNNGSNNPAQRDRRRVHFDDSGTANRLKKISLIPNIKEIVYLGEALGPRFVRTIKQVSRCSSFGSLWTITAPDGRRFMVKWSSVKCGDSPNIQIVRNELSALRRIRRIPGLVLLELIGDYNIEEIFLMRWMGQISLRERLWHGGPFDLRTTAFQMARLLQAVYNMHLEGVVHSNIGPENIMFGEDGNLTLFDFGCSVLLHEGPRLYSGIPLGTGSDDNAFSERCPVHQAFKEGDSDYFIDYVGLANVWYEMRTSIGPLKLSFKSDLDLMRCRDGLLLPVEISFLRRLLCRGDGRQFKSLAEIKAHEVFKDVDWKQLD